MFEAKLAQGTVLKKILEALIGLVTDANWECTAKGMTLQSMDSSHVALCCLNLKSDAFENYRCDRTVTIGINLPMMSRVLKCASNDDNVTLISEENSDKLTFKFDSSQGDRDSEYEVKLTNIDSDSLGIPDQEYDCIIKMPSGELSRICRDLSQFGDTLEIRCTKNGVEFKTDGDNGTGKINLKPSTNADKEEDNVTIEMNEPVALTFASRYMCLFTKATPLAPQVSLHLVKDSPLVVEYPIGDSGDLKFFLAPKIEEDDTAA